MSRRAKAPVGGMVLALVLAGTAAGAAPQQVTMIMREFSYSPSRITVQAGMPVAIKLVNRGKVPHEFMLYDTPKHPLNSTMGHEWVERTNYFHGMKVTATGGRSRMKGPDLFEVAIRPGQSAVLTFTPLRKGSFEFGCLIEGHYESGQRGVLTIK